MKNHVIISDQTRFETLRQIVADDMPIINSMFFDKVKKDPTLEAVWLQYDPVYDKLYGKTESVAARKLIEALEEMLYNNLSASMADSILSKRNHLITNFEVAQASMLEPDEEAEQWAFWEHQDAVQDAQDKIDMYWNEY